MALGEKGYVRSTASFRRRTEGFTVLVGDPKERLVGATVVSPHAGETVAELAAVIRRSGSMSGIAGTVHPYPSYGDGVWSAATTQFRTRLRRPLAARAIGLARAVMRLRHP